MAATQTKEHCGDVILHAAVKWPGLQWVASGIPEGAEAMKRESENRG